MEVERGRHFSGVGIPVTGSMIRSVSTGHGIGVTQADKAEQHHDTFDQKERMCVGRRGAEPLSELNVDTSSNGHGVARSQGDSTGTLYVSIGHGVAGA
eukprot:3939948-Rhodomonas_salina.5